MTRALLKRSVQPHQILVTSRTPTPHSSEQFWRSVGASATHSFLRVDVLERQSIADAVKKADVVVNLVGVLDEQGAYTFDAVHARVINIHVALIRNRRADGLRNASRKAARVKSWCMSAPLVPTRPVRWVMRAAKVAASRPSPTVSNHSHLLLRRLFCVQA